MKKYKATVYRTYSLNLEYTSDDAPEMIDADGKAEWISRTVDIKDWDLEDVAIDSYEVY